MIYFKDQRFYRTECTCESEGKALSPSLFYNNHGQCQWCVFVGDIELLEEEVIIAEFEEEQFDKHEEVYAQHF